MRLFASATRNSEILVIEDRFREFCVVGIGNHARTKLIPALLANGQTVTAIVSRQAVQPGIAAPIFATVEQAVEALPRTTAFFVATPPHLHLEQSRVILDKGFDLFLEKPAFVARAAALEISSLCEARSAVLVESLMHRYTRLYAELLDFWSRSASSVRQIRIAFLVDRPPHGTFRSKKHIACSTVFDIGCYPMSLLADMGLGEVDFRVADVQFAADPDKRRARIIGSAGEIAVELDIGVGGEYTNSVHFNLNNGDAVSFSPFFYGRRAERSICVSSGGADVRRTFLDEDAFATMLGRRRSEWRADQSSRLGQMVEVTGRLEVLAAEADGWRPS